MPKKVLLVIRWPVGGIRTFIRYVYRNFDHRTWQFTILAPDLPEMQVLIEDLSDFEICYVPTESNPSIISFIVKISRELLRCRFDLLHSHGFTSGICSALPARFRQVTHLMTSHDVINEKQFVGINGKLKKIAMKFIFHLIGTIHSVSYDAQSNFLAHFPSMSAPQGRCIVIPNGIEVERFKEAAPREFRKELDLQENVFLIGFLGRFMSQKGFRYVIEAIELLHKDFNLPKQPLILSFCEDGYVREEKQVIKDRGLDRYFRFMPFAPNIAGTIKGLDLVVMPSLWEACGLVAMEVMVSGTPFIGTDCIGLREVLCNTPAIIIPSADSQAIADAISREIVTSSRSNFLSFRDEAAERFDVVKSSQLIEKLYQELTSRASSRDC